MLDPPNHELRVWFEDHLKWWRFRYVWSVIAICWQWGLRSQEEYDAWLECSECLVPPRDRSN
jgi:hypothetical protein